LKQHRLLSSDQLRELTASILPGCTDPQVLARELIRRDWLTPFAANRLLAGKAGELVLGQYVLLDRLGEGGMGIVYKARHTKMNRIVALKVIRKERLTNPEVVQRFEREVEMAAQLAHPNVVIAYDAAQVGDVHFFAMEFVEGKDLANYVTERGPLSVPKACSYIQQAALGLQHAFERGMIHRDIKPANLLVTANGTAVKLLDLGLARLSSADAELIGQPLTQSGAVVGTPDYIAPEQARNPRNADIRADIYALGCTLYFCLTGRSPFRGDTLTETLLKHQFEDAVPLEQVRSDIPPALVAIVRKMMAKNPEDRYRKPAEVAAALEPFAAAGKNGAPPAEVMQGIAPVPMAMPAARQGYPAAAVSLEAPLVRKPAHGIGLWLVLLAVVGLGGMLLFVGLVTVYLLLRPGEKSSTIAAKQAPEPAPAPVPPRIDADKARRHFDEARRLMQAKQIDQAIAELNQAIAANPEFADAYFVRASAYFAKGDLNKALEDNDTFARLKPKDGIPRFNRGIIYSIKGDKLRAIEEYSKAIEITPGYTAALVNRGACYLDTQQFDLARRDFDAVLTLDAVNVAAYGNRGLLFYRQKDYDLALADLNRAIDLNGKDATAWYNRSLVHRKKGNIAQADADLARSKELDPKAERN
jgi:tetratricopeptide (TPR) repeat protein/tRNA A-37 threonylcarbamoyl transferase component Bud32